MHVGSLHNDTFWHFDSPDGGASCTYDLDYPPSARSGPAQDHPANDSTPAAADAHDASEVPAHTAEEPAGPVTPISTSTTSKAPLKQGTCPSSR